MLALGLESRGRFKVENSFITHRSAGTGGIDSLSNPDDRRKLVKFLLSIDASTEPVNP